MCGSVFRQFPRKPGCTLPESSRKLTSTPFRWARALKDHIGHGLKPIGSGDVEGAGLGAQTPAPAEFRGVSCLAFSLFQGVHQGLRGLICA